MDGVRFVDPASRAKAMQAHLKAVAESIVSDTSGDLEFQKYLTLKGYCWNYSPSNWFLIHAQAPESSFVAGLTALGNIAKEQGHTALDRGRGKRELVWIAPGSHAVWIWGAPHTYKVKVINKETGEEDEVIKKGRCQPLAIWAAENIRYSDTKQQFEIPNYRRAIDDPALYSSLLNFAHSHDIKVTDTGILGAQGISLGGHILQQVSTPWQKRIATLVHEIGHELLHTSTERKEEERKILEAEAEGIGATVLRYFGHDTAISASYLRNWEVTPKIVLRSMGRILKVAQAIVEYIEERKPGFQAQT